MLDSELSGAKIFYDQDGQPKEALISYEVFREVQKLLERLRADPDQGYFWSDEWQARIEEGEADIQAGRTFQAKENQVEEALAWLDE
jgi:hypothetical protein